MTDTNTIFLYVAAPLASASFYTDLFGIEPVDASPTFALFILPSGLALGLWEKERVQPAPAAGGGGSEIGFKVQGTAEIDSTHADWQAKGATIAFPPTDLDFGRSFVALDPDGHRLRVYTVAEEI
ncbi:VOC family protein [Candidatus Phycosocius spiralis]|uniref:Drug:proton antiporter n=1 Tax=Candidatus Phycosocius spiralis TaxID=2815099 RepID=A0ABQ4PSK0_9PROT|nr:VOC family protein [Candidatus Phycosocius spiralis]GIU65948.1 drug:proton antiporter [Candidatus Phycosocius spiralis]